MLEWDFHGYDKNRNQIQAETSCLGSPWWPRWLSFARVAVRNAGGSVDAAANIQSWIADHPAFEDAVCRDYWIPSSTWDRSDETQMRIGETMRDDILVCAVSFRSQELVQTMKTRHSYGRADLYFSEAAYLSILSMNFKVTPKERRSTGTRLNLFDFKVSTLARSEANAHCYLCAISLLNHSSNLHIPAPHPL